MGNRSQVHRRQKWSKWWLFGYGVHRVVTWSNVPPHHPQCNDPPSNEAKHHTPGNPKQSLVSCCTITIVMWLFYPKAWFYRFYPPIIVFLSGFIFHFGLTWNGQDGEEDKAVQRGRKDFTALRGAKFYFPPILELYPAKHHIHETSLTWPGCGFTLKRYIHSDIIE